MTNAAAWKGFAAGVALTALVAAALGPCARAETKPTPAPTPTRDAPQETRAEPRRGREAKRRAQDAPEAARAAEPPAARTPAADADFPGVDVEVIDFDGALVSHATVYALRPGVEWRPGDSDPPHAVTDDAGRCRLSVLRSGRYDVGAASRLLHALARDVDVPGAETVRVALPEPADVVVQYDSSLEGRGDARIWIGPGDDAVSLWPGRATRPRWGRETSARREDSRVFELPRGASFVCRTLDERGLRIEPERGVAPADVSVAWDGSYSATLRFVFEPAGASFPHPYALHVEVAAGEGADERTHAWDVGFAADAPAKTDALVFPFRVPSAAGSIRWKGEGILPGETTYADLAKNAATEMTLHIRLASEAPRPKDRVAEADPRQIERTFRVEPAGSPEETTTGWLLAPDGSAFSTSDPETLATAGAKWALVARGDWTATPADVGSAAEGVVEFALRRGGYVVVVPEGAPPPTTLGAVSIARKDGLPLLHGLDEISASPRVPFAPGVVLGPLPEGAVELVVRVGDEIVAEASVVVRAGGYEPVRIAKIRGR